MLQATGYEGDIGLEVLWIDWEHCNECDNLSETILLRDRLREKLAGPGVELPGDGRVISGLHHFGITCTNADRSIAFYCDLFGLTLIADREVPRGGFVQDVTGVQGARVRLVHLQGYGVNVELLEYIEPPGDTKGTRVQSCRKRSPLLHRR